MPLTEHEAECGPARENGAPLTTFLFTFEKAGPARWLGHLDVMRAFERGLRRAGVLIALTQGHNPRPRLRFVFPAGVGLVAWADLVFADVIGTSREGEAPAEPHRARLLPSLGVSAEQVNACMPAGLRIVDVTKPDPQALAAGPNAYGVAEYRITLTVPHTAGPQDADRAAASVIAAHRLPMVRDADGKKREIDVRPFIADVSACSVGDGRAVFRVWTRFGNAGTVRPAELADLLARELPGAEPHLMERMCLMSRDLEGETQTHPWRHS